MCDRRPRGRRLCAMAIALGVALGILLMHGLDARAVAHGHGFVASPAAAEAAVGAAVSASAGLGVPAGVIETPAASASSMACACLAVLASVALLLLHLIRRGRFHGARPLTPTDGVGGHVAGVPRGRLKPVRPRVALCVSLC